MIKINAITWKEVLWKTWNMLVYEGEVDMAGTQVLPIYILPAFFGAF